jgi:hypothetical protein
MIMGAVYPGVPKPLVSFIRDEYAVRIFIESGTYMASTALWASEIFEKVYTIELSGELYSSAVQKYAHIKNIKFLQGTSSTVLAEILKEVDEPAVFWLDAHWSAGVTAGEGVPCPLTDEIRAVLNADPAHFILVDDARFMMMPPPESIEKPHDIPSWGEVFKLLDSHGKRYSVVWRDVLISVPVDKKESIYSFLSSQEDIVFHDIHADFAGAGVGTIVKSWRTALKGLRYLPGALFRSVSYRLNGKK